MHCSRGEIDFYTLWWGNLISKASKTTILTLSLRSQPEIQPFCVIRPDLNTNDLINKQILKYQPVLETSYHQCLSKLNYTPKPNPGRVAALNVFGWKALKAQCYTHFQIFISHQGLKWSSLAWFIMQETLLVSERKAYLALRLQPSTCLEGDSNKVVSEGGINTWQHILAHMYWKAEQVKVVTDGLLGSQDRNTHCW